VNGLRIALLLVAGAAVMLALGHGLKGAERRGWIKLHSNGKGTVTGAFSVMEEIFTPGRNQARQLQEQKKRLANRAPTPGDGLNDGPEIAGRYGGRLTIAAPTSDLSRSNTPSGIPPTGPTDRAGTPG
jgi:hypothetical protein